MAWIEKNELQFIDIPHVGRVFLHDRCYSAEELKDVKHVRYFHTTTCKKCGHEILNEKGFYFKAARGQKSGHGFICNDCLKKAMQSIQKFSGWKFNPYIQAIYIDDWEEFIDLSGKEIARAFDANSVEGLEKYVFDTWHKTDRLHPAFIAWTCDKNPFRLNSAGKEPANPSTGGNRHE